MTEPSSNLDLEIETLQEAISEEYRFVIEDPREDFHCHTGRPLARKLDYAENWWANVPPEAPGIEAPEQGDSSPRTPSYELASR